MRRFQSTHLHEVRSVRPTSPKTSWLFQSTHLHEVRFVLLHRTRRVPEHFNPRTCTRCDRNAFPSLTTVAEFQSTHLHEVRFAGFRDLFCAINFNPRTCTRCDNSPPTLSDMSDAFQSTHLHEVRLTRLPTPINSNRISIHAPARGAIFDARQQHLQAGHFNPRTCTRCDWYDEATPTADEISIHAPARGAMLSLADSLTYTTISIHAPARGAITLRLTTFTAYSDISIHAPARGAIPTVTAITERSHISIHAPARGAIACHRNG